MIRKYIHELRPGLLVARPNPVQFGHLALDILMALGEAREKAAKLAFIYPRRVVNPAIISLECPDVDTVRLSLTDRARATLAFARDEVPHRLRHARSNMLELLCDEGAAELTRWIRRDGTPQRLRSHLRRIKNQLGRRHWRYEEPPPTSPYFRRRLIRNPIEVRLPVELYEEARIAAEALGVAAGAPVVAIHAREAGYKAGGLEVHEKEQYGARPIRDDSWRNANIETYLPTIQVLTRLGYIVVRIGDPSMRPLQYPGVVDLALAHSNPLLQIYALLRAQFLICGESGPAAVSYLLNTPLLNVNATDPIGSFPVLPHGRLLLKRVFDRATGLELTPTEMLSEIYLRHLRDSTRYVYVDNTAGEILEATREMLDLVGKRGTKPDGHQRDYTRLATAAAVTWGRRLPYVRKWGADEGFLGEGYLARCQLDESWSRSAAAS